MLPKVLFIDRDGTLIAEPPDEQIDSLEKLHVFKDAVQGLSRISRLGYELVMLTNQDGLGTGSFPEKTFWPAQNKMLEAFKNAGTVFKEVLIDRSFVRENSPTRKPRTGLVTHYMTPDYDLKSSFVIGDRSTDMELAKNLGTKGIMVKPKAGHLEMVHQKGLKETVVLVVNDWNHVADYLEKLAKNGKGG